MTRIKDCLFVLVTVAAAVLGGVARPSAQTVETAPLNLEAKIALGGVSGRIDHMAFDSVRNRLFVAELQNNSVAVVDIKERKVNRGARQQHRNDLFPRGALIDRGSGRDQTLQFSSLTVFESCGFGLRPTRARAMPASHSPFDKRPFEFGEAAAIAAQIKHVQAMHYGGAGEHCSPGRSQTTSPRTCCGG